jgi:hypothetical protein
MTKVGTGSSCGSMTSRQSVRPPHRILVPVSHESRSLRASRSFIWNFNAGPVGWPPPIPELPTYSPCLNGMAIGRSPISFSIGTTNDWSSDAGCDHRPSIEIGSIIGSDNLARAMSQCPASFLMDLQSERESQRGCAASPERPCAKSKKTANAIFCAPGPCKETKPC